MVSTRVRDMAAASPLTGNEKFYADDGSSNVYVLPGQIATFTHEFVNVKDYGATGDGSTDDLGAIQSAIDVAFGPLVSPHGTSQPETNRILYFPGGRYRISQELIFPPLWGGKIIGAGRQTTKIVADDGVSCFIFNEGIAYSKISDISFSVDGDDTCLFLDWNNNPSGATHQANTYDSLLFESRTQGTCFGVILSDTGSDAQGDTSVFFNCFWVGFEIGFQGGSGLNAIGNEIVGGNFQACDTGISQSNGCVKVISGTDFENGDNNYDIDLRGGSGEQVTIIGCRTESQRFIRCNASFSGGQQTTIIGCNQQASSDDGDNVFFKAGPDGGVLINCQTTTGQILGFTNPGDLFASPIEQLIIKNCQFGRDDWADENVDARLEAVQVGLTVQGGGSGTAKQYNAVTYYGDADRYIADGANVISVRDYGAEGDGDADDTAAIQAAIDACFVTLNSPDADAASQGNSVLYFPPGKYMVSDTLQLLGVMGGVIRGAGRFTTLIETTDNSKSVFHANGFRGCTVQDLHIQCVGTPPDTGTCCFDLDDDGTYVNSSGNTFINVEFGLGDFGLRCGNSGLQCSETLLIGCFFGSCRKGWQVNNQNCVDNTMIGGGATECIEAGLQIGANGGNIELVQQAGFANNDVDLDWREGGGSVDTPVVVQACRTESENFIFVGRGRFHVSGCLQTGAAGFFFQDSGQDPSTIDTCETINGQIGMYSAGCSVRNFTTTDRADWYDTGSANFSYENITVDRNNTNVFLERGRVGDNYVIDSTSMLEVTTARINDVAFASLPGSPSTGTIATVNNSNTNVWGATIAGGGANRVLAFYNGTNWTVAGK